jgi:Holliday junction DNA helicase RuvA
MIALLKGIVEARMDPFIIIDVNGVGYKVYASHTVLSRLTGTGESIKLFTYTHVREDQLDLFGFAEPDDLRLFEMLISVSGIGPKSAIGIYSVGSRHDIVRAIHSGDVDFFTAVPRLGKKNAQKLIIELKSKLGSTEDFDVASAIQLESDEVVAALKQFGFTPSEAITAVRAIAKEGMSTSEKIRLALKQLGK